MIPPTAVTTQLLRVLGRVSAAGLAVVLLASTAAAQDDLEDVFGGLGTAEAEESEPPAQDRSAGHGTIRGQVFDGDSGLPVENATVIAVFPDPGDGSDPPQEVQVTDFDGAFEFSSLPPGNYTLTFVKAGYRTSSMRNFEVLADEVSTADFPLPGLPPASGGEVLDLDAFVVEASTVGEMMSALDLRLESDAVLNILSAEDLSRFAASDVADALKRVAGVNIVEGQFAIIRGLEERYSSTLYNGAPAPSPDPDRQSVQLDLFASDIVTNLQIAKTFEPEQPGNSAGGSINIVTQDYPDEPFFSLSVGSGFNDNATDRFLEYERFNPLGRETDDVIEREIGASFGGRMDLMGREFRFKGVFNDELDFDTAEGTREERQPDTVRRRRGTVVETGDLSLGILSLSGGSFDWTLSEEKEQQTWFLASGIDLDEDGNHKIDGSAFYTDKRNDIVERRENGFFPNLDYGPLLDAARVNGTTDVVLVDDNKSPLLVEFVVPSSALAPTRNDPNPARGHVFYAPFQEAASFGRERDLQLYQLNGDHVVDWLDGLSFDWAANYARTTQEQTSFSTEAFFEPDDVEAQIPDEAPLFDGSTLEPGVWLSRPAGVQFNSVDIDENQLFGRLDIEYVHALGEFAEATLRTGIWYEDSDRDVDSLFFLNSSLPFSICCAEGETPIDAVSGVFGSYRLDDLSSAGYEDFVNESERTIQAWHGGGKLAVLGDTLDLIGGVRIEDIHIESKNDPFLDGDPAFGEPLIFPSRYLLFDAIDNPAIPIEDRASGSNSGILGIQVPVGLVTPGLIDLPTREALQPLLNGEIDEREVLPSAAFTLRPSFSSFWSRLAFLDGVTLRGGYSQTVARPSFRELGYYVTQEPGSDELVVGNPQLQLSDVESFDARVEYVFGDLGDLFAFSLFQKTIEQPIEAIIVSDLIAGTDEIRSYQTFFNNQNDADLWGLEVEARVHLGLYGLLGPASEFLDYFSIGGNYTYIDAEVKRSEEEIARTERFFGVVDGETAAFSSYERKRRLFDQPEWIANADVSFEHPDWGTKVTLALFGISEVLDAPGAADPDGGVDFKLDRYRDEFFQLDLVASQSFSLPGDLGTLTFKSSLKNLTDSERAIVYDQEQTGRDIKEREFRIGRDYSFSLEFTHTFSGL